MSWLLDVNSAKMHHISHGSSQALPPPQLISARTLFTARPTEPPSSPPPTSPLPPLPEIAPQKKQGVRSPIRESERLERPVRPPRPATSLPDLKPRTITSPEIYRRQRNIELAAHTKFSPTQQRSPVKSVRKQLPPKSLEHRDSVRLHTSIPQASSTFSEDVLSALPKHFQPSSRQYLDASDGSLPNSRSGSDRPRAWQVYYRRPNTCPSKSKRRADTQKPVASIALLTPGRPPHSAEQMGNHYPVAHAPLPQPSRLCYVAQSRNILSDTLFPPRRSSKSALKGSSAGSPPSPSPSHKRSQAVTEFAFEFGNYHGSQHAGSRDSSTGDLTSLPRIPSTPNIHDLSSVQHATPLKHSQYFCTTDEAKGRPSEEAIAFASVPYAYTVHNAGPQPKTEHDILNAQSRGQGTPYLQGSTSHPCLPRSTSRRNNFRSTHTETGEEEEQEEEERQPIEEEIKEGKRKRLLWMIATISLVLVATVGILGGIILKLTNFDN